MRLRTILLAEDSEDDVFMFKMACVRAGVPHLLQIVTDGAAAVDYLMGKGQYADRMAYPLPDAIFLDINMPRMNGHEALAWLRLQPRLKRIPVIMLTGSLLKVDVDRAHSLGATSYIEKVYGRYQFGEAIKTLLQYWLELNVSPLCTIYAEATNPMVA